MFSQTLTSLLLPFLLMQGLLVRLRTPRLPAASGPCSGATGGGSDSFELTVLGESPVAGIGAPTHEYALAGQVASALTSRTGKNIKWRALGLSGATAQVALRELVPQMTGQNADAVIIALGVNDVIQWSGISKWGRDIEDLISGVRRQVGDPSIVLAGVPPMQYFPALPQPLKSVLGRRARLLDQASGDMARVLSGVVHVPFRVGLSRELFCEDGFHPSVLGYAEWGKKLAEAIPASA